MPHYIGPNRELTIVTRKVFENFNRCEDRRAWEAACEDQPNDSWVEVAVGEPSDEPDQEHLRQWLLSHGATEADEYVFVAISW